MCAGTNEHNQSMFSAVIKFVGQQKVATNMALPIPFPVTAQWMIKPFRSKRTIIGDQ